MHLLRLRSRCTFIPIERQWQQRLVTISCRCTGGIIHGEQHWHCMLAQCAACVCSRAHLASAHEHGIMHYPAACCSRAALRASPSRACERLATSRHAILHDCCTRLAAPNRDFRAFQPSPRIWPKQNRSDGSIGDRDARVRQGALCTEMNITLHRDAQR